MLRPFTGRKKRKAWKKTREKYMTEEKRQNLTEIGRGSYYNQDEWLEEFLDNKGAFHNGTDGNESDDSENDDKNYNESIEVVFRRCSSK